MNEYRDRVGPFVGWICSAGLGIAALLSAGGPVLAQEDTTVRWHDLRALQAVGIEDPEGVDMNLHLQTSFLDSLEPDRYGVPLEDLFRLNSDNLIELILEALGEELEDGRLELDYRPGKLRVVADEELQSRVAGIVAELKNQLLRSVELEIFVLPASAVPAGTAAVLGADEIDALIAQAESLDYSRQAARIGQRLRLGSEGRSAAMIDYDVEVATKGRAADPQITVLREGTAVSAIARARPGGGFFLRVWGRRGVADQPPRQLTLEQFAGAPLELPAMSTTLATSSAAVPDGGGLLIGQDWNESGVWLVRVKSAGAPAPATDRRSPFIPLGELAASPLVLPSPWLPQTSPSGGWTNPKYDLIRQLEGAAWERACDPGELVAELREECDRLEFDGGISLLDDSLYVNGSPELRELSALRVKQMSEALGQETIAFEVRLGLLPREVARRLVTEQAPEEIAGDLAHRLLGACRLGDTLLVLGGREQFYLLDHDVEVAEASVMPDPIIGNRFEGVSFWCRPTRFGERVLSAWVDLQVQAAAREPIDLPVAHWEPRQAEQTDDDPAPTGTFDLNSHIELPATARANLRSMVQLVEGEWTLLCCTGLAATDRSLVAVVKVR